MNVADKIVQCLEEAGVAWVFGVPGEETLDLMAALQTSDLTFVPVRHEQAAAFMAATCGRLTGTPGVCLTTLGPGALNAMTGVAYAYLGQMPLLMISGQKPIGEIKQGNFQMVDVIDALQPITHLSQRLMKPGATPSLLWHSLDRAARFPYGPVHIELAEDVARQPLPEEMVELGRFASNPPPAADTSAVATVVELIQRASAPLLICGQHAGRPDVSAALLALIERTQLPFATTQMGKGAVDERHPCYVGTTALSEHDFVHRMAEHADLLIMVGHNESEKPPVIASCHQQAIVHLNFTAPHIHETYFPSHALIGDLAASIHALTSQLEPLTANPFADLFDAFCSHEAELAGTADPLRVVQQVRAAMPAEGIVSLDNGMYKIWFTRHYRAYQPHTLLLDNALATMAAGLPVAIAASMIHPDRPVLAVCGDGGFMMSGQELETAIRLKVNLVVLIVVDNQFGMIRWKQQMDGFEAYGMDFGNPDFVALARSYGASGHFVTATDDLAATIRDCHQSGGVHVIATPIDYGADSVFSELEQLTGSTVG